jgi:hypothetical protein
VLPFEAFPPAHNLDGVDSRCRECKREDNRLWREAHPERVEAYNASRRTPPTELTCSECGETFYGRRDRLTCSRRCRDKRYQRLHPEAFEENRRRKYARRRERARA